MVFIPVIEVSTKVLNAKQSQVANPKNGIVYLHY